MSLPVIVLGSGGHTKVLIDALLLESVHVLGITDSDEQRVGENVLGVEVIGDDDLVLQHSTNGVLLVNGVGTIGTSFKRRELFLRFKKLGYSFKSVIHSSATIAYDVKLGEGVQIMAGAIIQPGSRIGENSIINTGALVDHDCYIGAHAHIAPGVTISGNVWIGDGAHIGTGASIIQGLRVGKESLVGAGSLVVKDVPDGAVVRGVPAKGEKQ